jgi:hypothetical protein
MDIATLTTIAMGFLTAIATKTGEGIATHVYETIRTRFTHEQDGGNATKALQTLTDGDTDFAGVVEKKLLNILKSDPAFAHELSRLLPSDPHQLLIAAEDAQASHIRMNNTLGRGEQAIDLGRRARADDVQFTIGQEKPNP